MKRSTRITTSLLVLIVLLFISYSSSLSQALAQDGSDPSGDEYITREENSTQDESTSSPNQQPILHTGHLGYDKETGQFLDDPTVHSTVLRSPEEQAELERLYQEFAGRSRPRLGAEG